MGTNFDSAHHQNSQTRRKNSCSYDLTLWALNEATCFPVGHNTHNGRQCLPCVAAAYKYKYIFSLKTLRCNFTNSSRYRRVWAFITAPTTASGSAPCCADPAASSSSSPLHQPQAPQRSWRAQTSRTLTTLRFDLSGSWANWKVG